METENTYIKNLKWINKHLPNIKISTKALISNKAIISNGCIFHAFTQVLDNAMIGKFVKLGHNVFVGKNVSIGRESNIQGNVFIPEGTKIGQGVFVGPGTTFCNVKLPSANNKQKFEEIIIGNNTMIGANCTILPGISIGNDAIIGAGSVVTSAIPDGCKAYGNPAKILI